MEPYASLEENILTQNSNGNGIVRMNGTRKISSPVDERIQWHGVGMSGAIFHMAIQFRLIGN